MYTILFYFLLLSANQLIFISVMQFYPLMRAKIIWFNTFPLEILPLELLTNIFPIYIYIYVEKKETLFLDIKAGVHSFY